MFGSVLLFANVRFPRLGFAGYLIPIQFVYVPTEIAENSPSTTLSQKEKGSSNNFFAFLSLGFS